MTYQNTWSPYYAGVAIFILMALFFGLQLMIMLAMQSLSLQLDNASLMVYSTIVFAIMMLLIIFGWAYYLKTKNGLADIGLILGNKTCKKQPFLIALVLLFAWIGIGHCLSNWLDKTPMTFMEDLISEQSFYALLILVVMIAPIYEELLFRGLIFGLISQATVKNKRTQAFWAIGVSSLLFTLVHLQYDWFGMLLILLLAILLGWVRYRSGSIVIPIILHSINNGLAMGEFLYRHY